MLMHAPKSTMKQRYRPWAEHPHLQVKIQGYFVKPRKPIALTKFWQNQCFKTQAQNMGGQKSNNPPFACRHECVLALFHTFYHLGIQHKYLLWSVLSPMYSFARSPCLQLISDESVQPSTSNLMKPRKENFVFSSRKTSYKFFILAHSLFVS